MFDEEDFELLEEEEDEESYEDDTSSSFENRELDSKSKNEKQDNKKDSDKLNSAKEKNNSAPGGNNGSASGGGFKPGGNNANKAMNGAKAAGGKMPNKPPTGGAPGGANNKLNQAKNAADAAKNLASDDPEANKAGLKEAGKVAVKTAAKAYPATAAIPEPVIDVVYDKVANSEAGDKVFEKMVPMLKQIKRKILIILIPALLQILIPSFIVLLTVAIPMVAVDDLISGFKDFFSSLGHWLIGDGWCATDAICNLDDAKDFTGIVGASEHVYSSYCGEYDFVLDTEMMTATIFYDEMVVGLGVNKNNLTPNEDADNYNYGDAAGLYGSQLKILYPNLFNLTDVIWLDSFEEEDLNEDYFIDYINDFKDKIDDRLDEIQSGDNKEEKEMTEEEAKKYVCTPDYDAYKEYLTDDFIPSTAINKLRKDPSKGYDEYTDDFIVGDLLSFAKHYEGELSTIVSGGTITVGAGSAGAVPNEIIEASESPLGNQPNGNSSCFGFYSPTNCTAHNGVDLTSPTSSPKIHSIADGVVKGVDASAVHCEPDWKNGKACSVCANSRGNSVEIEHTVIINGVETKFISQYFHLSSVSVQNGQMVSKGDEIGIMGNTGCSSGRHLHFNLLDANKKRYNPEELLQAVGVTLRSDCEEARRICKG